MYRPPFVATNAFPDPMGKTRDDESARGVVSRAVIIPRALSILNERPPFLVLMAGAPCMSTGTEMSSTGPSTQRGITSCASAGRIIAWGGFDARQRNCSERNDLRNLFHLSAIIENSAELTRGPCLAAD